MTKKPPFWAVFLWYTLAILNTINSKYMEDEVLKKFEEQGRALDKIWKSVEKTRKYFMWTLIITVVTFVLPFILFLIFIPQIISTYTSGLNI